MVVGTRDFGDMTKRAQFTTPIQDIALNLMFAVMGEKRFNRTYDEYMDIAARLPPLKVLKSDINQMLSELHRLNYDCNGTLLPELCRFKAGDQRIIYEPYPRTISIQTLRVALEVAGMRQPKWRKDLMHCHF
jgi:hypothetical protein